MPESPLGGDFSTPAQPGGNWPPIIGAADEETGPGGGAAGSTVKNSEIPRVRYPTLTRVYPAGFWTSFNAVASPAVSNYTVDTIHAIPFPTSGGGKVVNMFLKTGALVAATTAAFRLAIYAPTSNANILPGQLLWQSSAQSAVVAADTVITVQVNKNVKAQSVYWACINRASFTGGSANASTFVGFSSPAFEDVLGYDSSGNTAGCVTASYTFGAFPTTFPNVVSLVSGATAARPGLFLEFGET